ncbi:MAG TPA: bifunctional DNA primase/polymerase [Galbitalea sp.]|jgi:hypothetical protein|nr:bifunctional DNA primase/polymerase [Galbitalea sp.]
MDLVALVSEASRLPLPLAATHLAMGGLPVFPCVPGEKRPLTEHGFHDASAQLDQVRAWWTRTPEANIGIPTGAASGIDVVDIDNHPQGSGFAPFERARRAGLVSGWAALIRTPSGGIHAYYPADPNRRQQSWQAPRAHIDFRGDGGYILAPPSHAGVDSQQAGYVLFATARRATGSVDAEALHAFLDPTPAPSSSSHHRQQLDVDGLARWVAARGEGERNRALFWAACRGAENGIPPEELHAILGPAAYQAGLPPREAATTIRSALRITAGRGPTNRAVPADPSPTIQPTDSGLRML